MLRERSSNATDCESSRFLVAIGLFDQANAEDPNRERVGGADEPKELVYARRMTVRLADLAPDASEALRLAVRCQHIRRWTSRRSDYPAGRTGYRQWRSARAVYHAETAGALLQRAGYDPAEVARVQALVRKERLIADPEAQTLEDVACLVFLEHYAAEFARQHDTAKVVSVLQKTWRKMSTRARAAAPTLELESAVTDLLQQIEKTAS